MAQPLQERVVSHPVHQVVPQPIVVTVVENLQEHDEPSRRKDFWRWTAGIGWALDLLLLGWAIFLRQNGLVSTHGTSDKSYLDASELGGSNLNTNDATYAELLERELLEERSITETDGQLGSMLEKLKSDLAQLAGRLQGQSTPSEDQEVISKVSTLEAKVDADKLLLQRRDGVFMGELEGKLETLRSVSARLHRNMVIEKRGFVGVVPKSGNSWNGNTEVVEFLQGSALPVALAVAASVGVAWLSQQFVRVATAWRRKEWTKAERVRKVQRWRFRQLQDRGSHLFDQLGKGKVSEAQHDLGLLAASVGKWASEPTWEEVFRTEAAAFWQRWGPQAFKLEAVLPGVQEVPREPKSAAKWVAERWFTSAQKVVKDAAEVALASWARGDPEPEATNVGPPAVQEGAPEPGRVGEDGVKQAEVPSKMEGSQAQGTGLVIRLFARWPEPSEWVSITNLPLAGGWREKALRLLIPAEKDVEDLPILGPLCESLLTAVVSNQVKQSVSTSVWGALTTDLWRFRGSQKQFEMGYEVVEVESQVPEKMCEIARSLPRSGTPGCVVRMDGLKPEFEPSET